MGRAQEISPVSLRSLTILAMGVLSLVPCPGADQKIALAQDARKLMPEFSYCVAYVLRGGKDGSPAAVLAPGAEVIDSRALSTLATGEARLSPEQAARLLAAASADIQPIAKECYTPHHAFVFYGREDQAVGCIELCLTCNGAKMKPNISPGVDRLLRYDMQAMARILDALKLPLTPYGGFQEFRKGKEKERNFDREWRRLSKRSPEEIAGLEAVIEELSRKENPSEEETEALRLLRQSLEKEKMLE